VRTVKTSSGATAVQIVHSNRRGSRDIEHIGSAHSDAEVEVLKIAARQRLAAGQGVLDLGLGVPSGISDSSSVPPLGHVVATVSSLPLRVSSASMSGRMRTRRGKPSVIATSACPCDSPAVRNRSSVTGEPSRGRRVR